jgi:pimeloyl-ACP methyl ester carboxylesterase
MIGLVSLFALTGCELFFPAPSPMPTRARFVLDASHAARCAVVFMPGFWDDDRGFIDHGFVDDLHARRFDVDTVSAAATFGYYLDRTLLVRLREDVMQPLEAKGYKEIWIVGISMGGLGTVLMARDQAPHVAGIYLLAPYLGKDGIQNEINAAGGLQRWAPGNGPADDDRDLWRYLQSATRTANGPPEIYLGAGDRDPHRSVTPHPLAEAIAADHRFHAPGGHDWDAWKILWTSFLDRSDFRSHCGPTPAPPDQSSVAKQVNAERLTGTQ